jgi:hypothetical protein
MTDRETIFAYRMRQTEESLFEAVRMLEADFSPRSIVNIQNYRDFAEVSKEDAHNAVLSAQEFVNAIKGLTK